MQARSIQNFFFHFSLVSFRELGKFEVIRIHDFLKLMFRVLKVATLVDEVVLPVARKAAYSD